MFTELTAEILQEVGLELVLVEEVVTLVDHRLEAAAADCLGLLGHHLVEVLLPLVLRVGIEVDAQRFVADHLHGLLVPVAGIIIQVERQHPSLERAGSQCYGFTFVHNMKILWLILILRQMLGMRTCRPASVANHFASFPADWNRGYFLTPITRSNSTFRKRTKRPFFSRGIWWNCSTPYTASRERWNRSIASLTV